MTSLMRSWLAVVSLSIAVTAGCAEWKAALDDALKGQNGGTGTGAMPGTASDPGAGAPSETGSGGSTGTGTAGSTGTGCVKVDGGGGPSSCKDAATWKTYGIDACAQQKLVLVDIAYGPVCGAGFEDAVYLCCAGGTSTATGQGGSGGGAVSCDAYTNPAGAVCKRCVDASGAVVTEDCPPPAPPQTCTKISDGGPSSCKDATTWKQDGAASCAQLGLTLTDIAYGTPCGTDFQDAVYVCCGTIGSTCSVAIDGLGNTCKTCWDANGVVVESACTASGVTCASSSTADGATCKTCKYPDGRIYSAECNGGSPTSTEICDLKTNADGTSCKVCNEPDGTTISSCP